MFNNPAQQFWIHDKTGEKKSGLRSLISKTLIFQKDVEVGRVSLLNANHNYRKPKIGNALSDLRQSMNSQVKFVLDIALF